MLRVGHPRRATVFATTVLPSYSGRMDEDRGNLQALREILSAYVRVLERPEELLRVCAESPGDTAAAVAAVAEAFEVSDIAAQAILDLQVRRFTPESFVQIRAELADVERRLADASA